MGNLWTWISSASFSSSLSVMWVAGFLLATVRGGGTNIQTDTHTNIWTLLPLNGSRPYLLFLQLCLLLMGSTEWERNREKIPAWNKMFRNLGVCHSDDIFYLWDMYGLNAETGVVDAWWSEDNKLNSRRWAGVVAEKYLDIFCTTSKTLLGRYLRWV